MLNSVLLHLEGVDQAKPVIRVGVALARHSEARLRGLTLLDTRRDADAACSEAAISAVMQHSRQQLAKRQQESVRFDLSQACLQAGLNFDVRRRCGDPLQVLPQEAQFHDLVITSTAGSSDGGGHASDLSPRDLVDLLQRGVQPLLVLRGQSSSIERVLMVYDGREGSGRAIRSYLNLNIFSDADHRLLAIGDSQGKAQSALAEMADYCAGHRARFETGFLCGKVRRLLVPYAEQWQADLVVMGIGRGNRWLRRLLGETAIDLLNRIPCGLYAAA